MTGGYKLAAFDMDGTLLDSDKKIRQDSIDALQKASDLGRYLCLSTGRNSSELEEYKRLVPMIRYYICTSGALIVDVKTNETLFANPFNSETVLKLLELGQKFSAVIQILGSDSGIMCRSENSPVPRNGNKRDPMAGLVMEKCAEVIEKYRSDPFPVYKINFYCADRPACEEVYSQLQNIDITVCYGSPRSVECSPAGVSKAVGLAELCRLLDIDISETIAVGDGDNDIGILRAAGLGVAMGNADDEVKKAADTVTESNDSNGIQQVIMNYLIW